MTDSLSPDALALAARVRSRADAEPWLPVPSQEALGRVAGLMRPFEVERLAADADGSASVYLLGG